MLVNPIEESVAAVDEKLLEVVQTDVDLLQDASQHIIDSGGKRLRPRLLFLSYLAAGGQELQRAVPLAAAVELVHTATLVHDDINDHSPTRRGKVAVHARWGRTFALLTGDYLFTKVYELMAPYGARHNVIMADACVRLVEGETLQAEAAKAGRIDQDTYQKIIARKTASLFEAAARMGAILGEGDRATLDALTEYAFNLGLAFQIVDDVLDIVGDPETMGKPVGSDVVQGAGAMMAQNGRQPSSDGAADVAPDGAVAPAAADAADPIAEMMAQLRDSGAVDLALAKATEYASRAINALATLPESPARDQLRELVDMVVERER
ncbi:MAG: polyprenyl synthetase family protein [Chloroflexota bacterium]|nr:MAG: polyprenyl synthetase family protein [Chloroflexota bacterium]